MKAGKIWGQTELIHANGVLEFHRIEYKAGYKCSEHEHEFKWNGFYVESGKMIVRVWQNDYDLVDETLLLPGDFTQVKPGCIHQFEGVEDGVAFELYWAEFNHLDIKRRSVGRSTLSMHEYEDNPSDIDRDYETDPLKRVIDEQAELNYVTARTVTEDLLVVEKDYEAMKASILGTGSILNED